MSSEFFTLTVEYGGQKASVQLTKDAITDEPIVARMITGRLLPKIGLPYKASRS